MEGRQESVLEEELLQLRNGLEVIVSRRLGGGADAQDAVQEIMMRALVAVRGGRVRDVASLPAFVHGIARHVTVDVMRGRCRRGGDVPFPDTLAARDPGTLESLIRRQEIDAAADALRQLDTEEQSLLRRIFIDGHSIVEIARALGVPAERLRKRKSRALRRLRALLRNADGHVLHGSPKKDT